MQLAGATDASGRVLIAGDFNSTWRSGVCTWLERHGWREAYRLRGQERAFTFPVFGRYFGLPLGRFLRVDQIWCGAGLEPIGAWIPGDVGSDHRPILAAFDLGQRAN